MSKKIRHRLILIIGCLFIVFLCFLSIQLIFHSQNETEKTSVIKTEKKDSALDKRIAAYRKKHPEYSKSEATKRVKMNLDYDAYTHVEEVSDLDNLQMLVNKYHNLPENYEPSDLVTVTNSGENDAKMRKEAAEAFEQLVNAAKAEGITLSACSAYRSYAYQKNLYDNGVSNYGQDYADAYWTRPGFSEHQTGLSVDIRLDGDTSDLDAPRNSSNYPWLLENMHKYGFIVRYPDDKEEYTLISPESWHLRYVGKDLATYLYENNLCLEEYYASK